MKVINLNESQYLRLFESEFHDTFGSDDTTPQNLDSNRYSMVDAVTTGEDGEEHLVEPEGNDIKGRIKKGNRFDGSSRKGDDIASDGPWLTYKNRGGF